MGTSLFFTRLSFCGGKTLKGNTDSLFWRKLPNFSTSTFSFLFFSLRVCHYRSGHRTELVPIKSKSVSGCSPVLLHYKIDKRKHWWTSQTSSMGYGWIRGLTRNTFPLNCPSLNSNSLIDESLPNVNKNKALK